MKIYGSGFVALALWLSVAVAPAYAHNVWCHCSFTDPKVTLEYFSKAGEVYHVLSHDVIKKWHDTNGPLEFGVLAEFRSKLDPNAKVQPELFKQTLFGLEALRFNLDVLDSRLKELNEVVRKGTVVPEFETALAKTFREDRPYERVREAGVRYSNLGGKDTDRVDQLSALPIKASADIADVLRADLVPLKRTLDEVIVGLRNVLPLAEKGEFAAVMLSGRNAFGDKMPQLTNMISAYERLYVRSCMNTITVTMQIYPRGFEWLTKK